MKNPNQKSDVAIAVKNLSKEFKIPHEKITTLRSAFVNLFRKNAYESFYVLKDISFEVKKGEFFGILGRNGSGKSTLLKILAHVYTADKGEVKLNGLVSPFLELGIGFNPELSGRDNIYLNATVLGLTEKEIDAKFDSIVAFSELERFIDQKLKNYSSGMQVRLSFSVAIHANREILLMDEVLAVGDSNFQLKCLREFARYKEMGKTVILVTHDIGTVQRYCDRAMLLRNGEVALIGSAEEVGNEYIYQNMSDEEKRIIKEREQAKIKAEKDGKENEKRLIAERKRQDEERLQAEKKAEKLKGEERRRELKRIEDERLAQIEEKNRIERDERARLEGEKKKQEEEKRNKIAEITNVEFLDKYGKSKNTFETGESVDIKIDYKLLKAKKGKVNIGLSIAREGGVSILSFTTEIDRFILDSGREHVFLSFKELPLLKGSYFINITLYGETNTEIFDFRPKLSAFNVFSFGKDAQSGGYFRLCHEWKDK
jgi:ABC-2 type transport system ATP-binding protein